MDIASAMLRRLNTGVPSYSSSDGGTYYRYGGGGSYYRTSSGHTYYYHTGYTAFENRFGILLVGLLLVFAVVFLIAVYQDQHSKNRERQMAIAAQYPPGRPDMNRFVPYSQPSPPPQQQQQQYPPANVVMGQPVTEDEHLGGANFTSSPSAPPNTFQQDGYHSQTPPNTDLTASAIHNCNAFCKKASHEITVVAASCCEAASKEFRSLATRYGCDEYAPFCTSPYLQTPHAENMEEGDDENMPPGTIKHGEGEKGKDPQDNTKHTMDTENQDNTKQGYASASSSATSYRECSVRIEPLMSPKPPEIPLLELPSRVVTPTPSTPADHDESQFLSRPQYPRSGVIINHIQFQDEGVNSSSPPPLTYGTSPDKVDTHVVFRNNNQHSDGVDKRKNWYTMLKYQSRVHGLGDFATVSFCSLAVVALYMHYQDGLEARFSEHRFNAPVGIATAIAIVVGIALYVYLVALQTLAKTPTAVYIVDTNEVMLCLIGLVYSFVWATRLAEDLYVIIDAATAGYLTLLGVYIGVLLVVIIGRRQARVEDAQMNQQHHSTMMYGQQGDPNQQYQHTPYMA